MKEQIQSKARESQDQYLKSIGCSGWMDAVRIWKTDIHICAGGK